MGRFKTPMTSFTNYIKTEPDAPGPRLTPAALITQEALEHVRKHWNLPDAEVGMWVLMQPNGDAILMTDSNFQAKYTHAHTTY